MGNLLTEYGEFFWYDRPPKNSIQNKNMNDI